MTSLVATAPGKLVLCGEYAVLDGAPAISAAVDRRARVVIRDGSDLEPGVDIVVTTIGFRDGEYHYRRTASGLEPAGGQRGLALFEAAYGNAGLPAGTRQSIELDTSPFFAGGVKLGLGSSAALTVALVHGLAAWGGEESGAGLRSQDLHSHLQDGRGSGVDVATSFDGGLIRYEREIVASDERTAVTVSRRQDLAWPAGLEAAVLSSGIAASTPARLERLDAAVRAPISDVLVGVAAEAADAWHRGVAGEVLEATGRFARTLADFSDAYDLDVFGGGHAALAELAETQGLVYKPCGAGGGDVGVVLGEDTVAIARFIEQAALSGFVLLDVHLGGKTQVEGLSVEWTHD